MGVGYFDLDELVLVEVEVRRSLVISDLENKHTTHVEVHVRVVLKMLPCINKGSLFIVCHN